jgi:hypothetical protein
MLIGTTAANTFSISSTGCYQVLTTAPDSCSSLSPEKCIGLLQIPTLAIGQAKIFPQPANDYVIIKVPSAGKKAFIKITDITGRAVLESNIPYDGKISVSELTNGIYFATITDESYVYAQKIMVMRP